MKKKIVSALLIVALIAAFIPFSAFANAQMPAFINFEPSATTVAAGEEITMSISTLAAATHVFAEVDGTRVNAVEQTRPMPAAGTRNWTLVITPEESQAVTVYANTANHTQGAAAITVHVTIDGAITGEVTINSVRTSGNAIFHGDMVTFIIATGNAVEYVFTEVNGQWVRAVLINTHAQTGEKTWQLVVKPHATQTLTIYANSEFVRGNVTVQQLVTVQLLMHLTPQPPTSAPAPQPTQGGASFGSNPTIRGNLTVGRNVRFGSNASIRGDVVTGDNVTFGSNATIQNNVTIGSNVNFGSNATIRNNVSIGNNVRFGSNAIIQDNVTIGNNVTFGSNATVTSGSYVPDGTHVRNNVTW